MPFSICVDTRGRILGLNPADMTGNTGWISVSEEALTQRIGMDTAALSDALIDENGAPRYLFADGYACARTPEDRAADAQDAPTSLAAQWRTDVENALVELADLLAGGE
ncbi:MAG: hypothetical protein LLF96_09895 [Eubacteriales bacterium]|nr:hypothetical protein [Eubacteriales bacterium]